MCMLTVPPSWCTRQGRGWRGRQNEWTYGVLERAVLALVGFSFHGEDDRDGERSTWQPYQERRGERERENNGTKGAITVERVR